MRFKAGDVISRQPSWWLYGAGNEVVAWAGSTYPSLTDAERAADIFRRSAALAKFELFQDRSDGWRWRAWLGDQKIATSGLSYLSEIAVWRAANEVRAAAALAPFRESHPALLRTAD